MDRKQNSVRSLANLYTVVIGVALSSAVVNLIDAPDGLRSITWVNGLLFLSFISTLIPFYHGALRHLDDAYIENTGNIKDGALILDFLLLFLHGIAFVILSLLLSNPSHFAWMITAVLVIDVGWAVFAHFGSSRDGGEEWKWLLINLFISIPLGTSLYIFNVTLEPYEDPRKLALAIVSVCVVRTLLDYIFCWRFYFPEEEKQK